MSAAAQEAFGLKIVSPSVVLYDEKAVSISAKNKVGPFDVLAGHANFFSLISECDVIVNTGKEKKTFPVKQGLIKVTQNAVVLYVDIDHITA